MKIKYRHEVKVIAERFEKVVEFTTDTPFSQIQIYGSLYQMFGFNDKGKELMLKMKINYWNKAEVSNE
ncbi:MAG: hypothetical protein WC275_01970 [Bacilli bacterium]